MKPSKYLARWFLAAEEATWLDRAPDNEQKLYARILALLEAVEKSCPEYLQGELMDLRRLKVKYEDEILSEAIPILHAALALKENE